MAELPLKTKKSLWKKKYTGYEHFLLFPNGFASAPGDTHVRVKVYYYFLSIY